MIATLATRPTRRLTVEEAEEAAFVAERRWSAAKHRGDRAAAAIQLGHFRAALRARREALRHDA